MPEFNVAGLCIPEKHYVVDISEKLMQIKELIDKGQYFTINRARQFGKTTTLNLLDQRLADGYIMVLISFEGLGAERFASSEIFCSTFIEIVGHALEFTSVSEAFLQAWKRQDVCDFMQLSRHITKVCKNHKMVLMIDEVDKISNNSVFLHFLGMLRDKYLSRQRGKDFTFHSVILASVSDIKNIKLRITQRADHQSQAQEGEVILNSPWNIAARFDVDLSFKPEEIATMLTAYEADHQTGMNIQSVSEAIYAHTNGYPFLVSRICKCMDEELQANWSVSSVQAAVKRVLGEQNTLFDDLFKNLENNEQLRKLIYRICFKGEHIAFSYDVHEISTGFMYGILKPRCESNDIAISNQLFEICIYDYFVLKDILSDSVKVTGVFKDDVVSNGKFNMQLCLEEGNRLRKADWVEHMGKRIFDVIV